MSASRRTLWIATAALALAIPAGSAAAADAPAPVRLALEFTGVTQRFEQTPKSFFKFKHERAAPPRAAARNTREALVVPAAPLHEALEGALEAYVAGEVARSPIGDGDWRAARQAMLAFYVARDFQPVWVGPDGLTPAAISALTRLARAEDDGLDLSDFPLPAGPLLGQSSAELAEAETVISAAVVAYAMQASGARLDPKRISPLITARPDVADPGAALASVASAANPGATLEDFNPRQQGYLDLRGLLSRARGETVATARPAPDGPTLGLGMTDPRVPFVRARLGVAPRKGAADSLVYDLPLAVAVAAFQRAHGLAPNGALTPAAYAALGGASAPSRRTNIVVNRTMILANMEMWRWEPRSMGEKRIEINIPDYSLRVMDGDELVHEARVIVGKPDTPTPIFSNRVRYLLVNPVWRVPDSIIRKEFAPHLALDPDYLARRGFEVKRVGGRLVVRQPPGEENALGRILFMFPNEHAVYLHDTPGRAMFAARRRAFSHGCVRVEQPMRLAELVMGGARAGWTAGRLQSLLGGRERTVSLPRAIPIHLEYFTEFVDGSGALQNREDIYGIAARVGGIFSHASQD